LADQDSDGAVAREPLEVATIVTDAVSVAEGQRDLAKFAALIDRYQTLLSTLAEISIERTKCGDPDRVAGILQLAAVVHFLRDDPEMDQGFVTPPTELFADLHDLSRGAKPKRLLARRDQPDAEPLHEGKPQKPGRPTDLFDDMWQGQLLEVIDVLVDSGMTVGDAYKFILKGLRRSRIGIGPTQFRHWRDRAKAGLAPNVTYLTREIARQGRPKKLDRVSAEKHALMLLQILRELNFPNK
jgi:hypothetical protein